MRKKPYSLQTNIPQDRTALMPFPHQVDQPPLRTWLIGFDFQATDLYIIFYIYIYIVVTTYYHALHACNHSLLTTKTYSSQRLSRTHRKLQTRRRF